MRKLHDYYFKKAKKEGYPARSVYKLAEAQERFHLLQRGDAVLDLGCYPGSWVRYAAKIVGPQGVVVGVDRQAGMSLASEAGAAAVTLIEADVNAAALVRRLAAIRPRFQVVLSDLAPQTTGNKWVDHQQSLRLARRALEIAAQLLASGGRFYCKVFQGEDCPAFVEEVRPYFKTTKVVKPKSSRDESRELFVLGSDFLPGPMSDICF